jgi:hypothetical protein
MAKLDNVLDALQDRKQPTGRRRMTAANFFLDLPELDEIRAGLTEVSERIGTAPETLLKRLDELQGSFPTVS